MKTFYNTDNIIKFEIYDKEISNFYTYEKPTTKRYNKRISHN